MLTFDKRKGSKPPKIWIWNAPVVSHGSCSLGSSCAHSPGWTYRQTLSHSAIQVCLGCEVCPLHSVLSRDIQFNPISVKCCMWYHDVVGTMELGLRSDFKQYVGSQTYFKNESFITRLEPLDSWSLFLFYRCWPGQFLSLCFSPLQLFLSSTDRLWDLQWWEFVMWWHETKRWRSVIFSEWEKLFSTVVLSIFFFLSQVK